VKSILSTKNTVSLLCNSQLHQFSKSLGSRSQRVHWRMKPRMKYIEHMLYDYEVFTFSFIGITW